MAQKNIHRSWNKIGVGLIALVTILFSGMAGPAQPALAANPDPLQIYYVTLPEHVMLQYFWDNFTGVALDPVSPVRSVTSIAIGTNGTVVYYDQWEDGGYDADLANPGSNIYHATNNPDGTHIWGDGVVANGCPPSINNTPNPCTLPEHDRLNRGAVITLDNQVVVNGSSGSYSRNPSQIFFDGRDKVGASLPVAVTRSMWPSGTGSMVADAQSVLPTERWGTQYVSPVGENNNNQGGSTSGSFRDVRLLIMAGPGGATINVDANANGNFTDPYDRNGYSMAQGEVITVNDPAATINGANGVKAGALVNATSGMVQVTLITSDYQSEYENRFYNLIPRGDWVSDYYGPVGTPTGGTQCTSNFIYNPNAASINVNYDFAGGSSPDGTVSIGARTALEMPSVPAGSGVRFYTTGGQAFLPLSMTDCPRGNNGNIYDWGHELYPVDQLSPELLIGWAPGCSNESYEGVCLDGNGTNRTTSRSFVWLTPLANTTIYVDTDGSGIACPGGAGAEKTIPATALNSYTVSDDPTARYYVHDRFSSQSYARNDPTPNNYTGAPVPVQQSWATNWIESGEADGPTAGVIWITGGVLQFRGTGGNETDYSIQRSRNLAGQQYSRLSFRIQWAGSFQSDDAIAVEISPDGGSTWTTLEIINGPITFATGQYASKVYITSAYNSANTTTRFRTIGNLETGDTWSIDEVHIDNTPDGDFDMTGSYVRTCDDVLLAAAFGQNPQSSFSNDDEAMDLGMGISPYGSQIRLNKTTDATFVAPGDEVTYRYEVSLLQTFSTSVNDVTVVDDFCAPTVYDSGDTNTNNVLDPGEVWIFTCTTRLYAPTTNTAIGYAFYGTEPIRSLPDQATVGLTSSVGDYVWVDEDGDGDQDAGEPGIPNARVTLTGTDADDNPVSLETYTDANGRYIFTDVPPSDANGYTIEIDDDTLPDGLAANPTYDENGIGTQHTTVVALGSGVEYTTADFGYNWASPNETNNNTGNGAIGDRVWIDADGDGFQDANEAGLAGATVTLYHDPDGDGVFDTVYATTTTDAAGNYIFDDLPVGAYAVGVSTPSGYTQTGDPDHPGVPCTACDGRTTTPIVLAPGDVYLNADFGYQPATAPSNTIGNLVFLDANGDGNWDTGEPGIPGVTVALLDASGKIIATTVTDASGAYSFPGLPDGTYTVWVNDTSNVLGELRQNSTPDNNNDGGQPCGTCNNRNTVTVSGGAGNIFQDFGYAPPGHSSGEGLIGDTIWLDTNGDGSYTPGEGLEGVVVNLFDSSGQIIARTVTNENGQYYFGELPAGSYTVDINTNSLPNYGIGLENFVDPDGGTPHRATLTLAAGEVNLDQDFGYRATTPNTIGGTIWNDTNANGLLSGESGRFGGVTVVLYDADGHVVATTTTDSSGNYSFTGLPDGTYRVDVTDEANVLNGYWHSSGPNPGQDNNSQSDPYTVTVSGGQTNTTADFGYYRDPARIGDFVWEDLNRDGIQDPGEPGIAGVTVQLTIVWPGGGSTTLTTVTDANGFYSFGNLLLDEDFDGVGAGEPTFSITFSTPATYELTTPNAGSDDTKDSDYTGSPLGVTVTQGQYNDTIDCGFRNTYLSITKTSDANAAVNPGDTIEYTVVVRNNTASRHTRIAITDPLPSGTTYVAQSTMAVGYAISGPQTYLDQFEARLYTNSNGTATWSSTWTEGGEEAADNPGNSPTGGYIIVTNNGGNNDELSFDTGGFGSYGGSAYSIERAANLAGAAAATLSFSYDEDGDCEGSDTVNVEVWDGSTWHNVLSVNGNFGGPNNFSQDISAWANANTIVRITVVGYNGSQENFAVDDMQISFTTVSPLTRDNVPGSANLNLADGTPPSLVVAGDGFALNPGQSMQVTFQVTVDDPVALFSIDNTASVVSEQQHDPEYASVSDPLNRPAAVGDRIWLDEDGDGVQDAGEAGIPNVRVTLTGTDVNGVPVSLETYTDAEGNYLFDVPPSDGSGYTISVDTDTLPDGLEANPTYDEDGTGTPHTSVVTVGSGEEHLTADFGYNWAPSGDVTNPGPGDTGAIGDRLWIDDGDGVQEPGEPGLGGIPVTLYYDPDGDGVYDTPYPNALDADGDPIGPTGTTTTDAAGNYIFDNLPAGGYVVVVNGGADPDGYTQTGDPDQPGMACTACDNQTTTPIVLAPGDVYVNADFGYQPTGDSSTIGDTVYFDADGNGSFGGSDHGIPGVTVALLDGSGNVIATTVTDAAGQYTFPGLPAGTYTVWVNDTANVLGGLAQTGDPDGGLDSRSTTTVNGVNDDLDQDHGYAPPGHGSGDGLIGDTIFLDRDGGNDYDPGEGLEGVKVKLYQDTNDDGNYDAGEPLVAATTTDENGNYYFGNLPAGNYVVVVDTTTLPAGVTNTVDPDDDGTPNNGDEDNQSGVSLSGGEVNLDQDFGYRDTSDPNTISGTIWEDTNADGTLNEAGRFAGVTVVLRDSNGNIVATTTTDANGDYSFTNLPDGTYTVDITDEANVLNGYWHSDGTNEGADNNSQPDPYTVTVGPGNRNDTTADFGYYREPADLGDLVWLDLNGDGILDTNEPGIGGVRVDLTITYPNGAGSTTLTTYTDRNGYYSFGNLLLDENWNGLGTDPEPTFSLSFETPPSMGTSPVGVGGEPNRGGDSNGTTTGTDPNYFYQGQTDLSYDSGFTSERRDLGDLPDDTTGAPYPTYFRPGPAHIIFPDGGDNIPDTLGIDTYAVWLGTIVDVEVDGQPNDAATLDDTTAAADEDGVAFPPSNTWTRGTQANIHLTLRSSAPDGTPDTVYYGLWIDWNGDGDFDDANDTFVASYGTTGSPAEVDVPVTMPDGPDGYVYGNWVYIRARVDDQPFTQDDYEGTRVNGEVEDYRQNWNIPTAVTLSNFWSTLGSGSVILHWETATELNNLGFHIERAESLTGPRTRLNADLIPSYAPGNPTGATYEFVDNAVAPGVTYYYWLSAVDTQMRTDTYGPLSQRLGSGTYLFFLPVVNR